MGRGRGHKWFVHLLRNPRFISPQRCGYKLRGSWRDFLSGREVDFNMRRGVRGGLKSGVLVVVRAGFDPSLTICCARSIAFFIDSLLLALDIWRRPFGSWMPMSLCSFCTLSNDRTKSFRSELPERGESTSFFRKSLISSGEYQEAFWLSLSGSTSIVFGASLKLTFLVKLLLLPRPLPCFFIVVTYCWPLDSNFSYAGGWNNESPGSGS